jgi:hypothetical protein
MQSVILVGWATVECCLREPNCSGMWFWWIREFSLWVTTRSISLLTVLKRLIGLWSGVRKWFARFYNGHYLGGFPGTGEISKPQNMIKILVRWMGALREILRSTVAEIPSVPGADLILRDWIRRHSSYGFVSWASVTYVWGRRKYLLTVRFTVRAWLAVPTFEIMDPFDVSC